MKGILKAKRSSDDQDKFQRLMTYYFTFPISREKAPEHSSEQGFFHLLEDSSMVDGIGGITWEGSLVLGYFMELLNYQKQSLGNNEVSVVELGAGNGILGLLMYQMGFNVMITDRTIDLMEANYQLLKRNIYSSTYSTSAMDVDEQFLSSFSDLNFHHHSGNSIEIKSLDWECDANTLRHNFLQKRYDILLGSEITCLIKQQPYLTQVIFQFALCNPNLVIFLTFDDIPCRNNPKSTYEREFLNTMKNNSFYSATVFTGKIHWERRTTATREEFATLSDVTLNYENDLHWLSIPKNIYLPAHSQPFENVSEWKTSEEEKQYDNIHYHHVNAFFRPTAINTCSRCQKQFFNSPCFSSNNLCCFHNGYYVCRRHPGETRLSIDGQGDRLGYYGNGKDNWEAKFWDCCGNEDANAIGCRRGAHTFY
jgi:hypothetical protein